jgi:hypothetical protein
MTNLALWAFDFSPQRHKGAEFVWFVMALLYLCGEDFSGLKPDPA